MFFNRVSETAFLQERLASNKSELIVLEGRRRIGKTELVKQLFKEHEERLYFFVNLTETQLLLNEFSSSILEQTGETQQFKSVKEFYSFLTQYSEKTRGKLLIVFDEFQRFNEVEKGFITGLQQAWDNDFKDNKKTMLVLSGSSISLIRRLTAGSGAPLHGRRTGQWHLEPFKYADFRLAFTEYSEEEKIRAYSIFGGTPHYFTQLARSANPVFLHEIRKNILEKGAQLREEPKELFSSEARRSTRYNAILQAIADGHRATTEIAGYASSKTLSAIKPASLPPYFKVLTKQLNILERDDPIFGKEKHGRYCFSDPFYEFWYKFIFPHQEALELENYSFIEEKIARELPALEGKTFEKICRQFLALHNNKKIKGLELGLTQLGAWWTRASNKHESTEIDIVGKNKDKLLLGEVKYTKNPMEENTLRNLIETKAKHVPYSGKIEFITFSKNGFTSECLDYAEKTNTTTLDLKEMTQHYQQLPQPPQTLATTFQ